ncbi:hypothetical protein ABK988_23145 [Vibrio parahaemolyticus]|nr:hypothetical protein [Vibrio parahaemolyticus]MDG2632678.1 hypothetical protein [Vibrio parahaemolyticus]
MKPTENIKHPFRDLTFFVSSVMATLFAVGYLYETAYLEFFGFNNSEILPEPSISIVYGFRYALLNGFSGVFFTAMILSLMFAFISVIKKDIQEAISKSEFIRNNFNWLAKVNQKKVNPLSFYIGLVVLFGVLILHAIFEGKSVGERVQYEKRVECLVYSDSDVAPIEGNVVRIRDGFIAFWEITSENEGKARLVSQRKVLETIYGKCPNKQFKSDS